MDGAAPAAAAEWRGVDIALTALTMKKPIAFLLLLLAALPSLAADRPAPYGTNTIYIPGFRTYMASGYAPSESNMALIREVSAKAAGLRLVAFDTSKNNAALLMCRMSFPVYGPGKTPFAALLEAAANLELAGAGRAVPDAPRVQATLDGFDFSSFGGGKWTLRATLRSPGMDALTVEHVHAYPVSAGAVAGCTDVTNAMVPAIESFLHALYADVRFVELMQHAP